MANVLLLVHRLPYPPNKGDKVRSYHLLKHLAAKHKVFLGTFVDDVADEVYVDKLRPHCADLFVSKLHPLWGKFRSILGLKPRQSMSVSYYKCSKMQSWVDKTLAAESIQAVVVFSSVMAQYVDSQRLKADQSLLVDFVDVDSAKWTQYAPQHRWPMSWLYRREGRHLLQFERDLAQRATHSFFVADNETALFRQLAPESAAVSSTLCNGVDALFFSPQDGWQTPFVKSIGGQTEMAVVFTGAMDYWPNVDAVTWFAQDILPELLKRWPQVRFYVVGRNPTPQVLALSSEAIVVTGTVHDVRPYLQFAAVVVAPLRVARGIQNKILEAMAMGRPVVASATCAHALVAPEADALVAADNADQFVQEISALLASPQRAMTMGHNGRALVLSQYSWEAHLSGIDRFLVSESPEYKNEYAH